MFSVNRLNDIYVSVEKLLSEKIYGNSWYRFRDAIKLNNGEVVETVFTK
jgi:hypothetical protein